MDFLIGTAKVLGTIVLIVFFVVGVLKANPRMHGDNRPMAEYTAGFLICAFSLACIYYVWF